MIRDCQEQLDWLLATYFTEKQAERVPVQIDRAAPKSVTDDDRAVLERMFNGRDGDRLRALYAGDALDYRKADGAPDWSSAIGRLLFALAFYTSKDAGRTDRLFRASGLYAVSETDRPKWDSRRGGSTWGEDRIGEVFAQCHETFGGRPAVGRIQIAPAASDDQAAEEHDADSVPALRAEIARLQRALLDRSDQADNLASIVEVQQHRIRKQEAELDAYREREKAFREVIAAPAKRLSPADKVTWLTMADKLELARTLDPDGARDGWATISLSGQAAITGVSEDVVSKTIAKFSEGAGALLERNLTRAPKIDPATGKVVKDEKGKTVWVSELRIRSHEPTATAILKAVATYAPETERNHGGTRKRVCPEHPNAPVTITWTCGEPGCTKVLDSQSQKPQVADSETTPPAVDVLRYLGPQDAVSEPLRPAVRDGDSGEPFARRPAPSRWHV